MKTSDLLRAERLYHAYMKKASECFRKSARAIEVSADLMRAKPRTRQMWWQAQVYREDSIKALQEGNQLHRRAAKLLERFPEMDTTP